MDFVVVIICGAVFGSFLNMLIYRLPREQSILSPPSRCPKCGSFLKWYMNIPILSYIFLGGKCFYCKETIPIRYLIVEILEVMIFLVCYLDWGFSLEFLLHAWFFTASLGIFFTDLETLLIPDSFSLLSLIPAIGIAALRGNLVESLAVAAGVFLLFYGVSIITNGGMGGGDTKYSASMSCFLGVFHSLFGLFTAFLLGSVIGIIFRILGIIKRGEPIPFGPFLVLGCLFSYGFGDYFIRLYLSLF
ncbi:Prepilin peptidase [Thermodesulfobium narugense DSM 14796]|uniref:Prepilin peptidase n=1 Tax=Thermodesulfobium narugense DSM 14796 TaxID=747365 RepID=M1E7M0_9BACT|nr:A24 family peptidase [Thermodesulfobium narugense]AEE14703.1 Prepilin peptidase [Thermodesulfobium narugense DSM 14796]